MFVNKGNAEFLCNIWHEIEASCILALVVKQLIDFS